MEHGCALPVSSCMIYLQYIDPDLSSFTLSHDGYLYHYLYHNVVCADNHDQQGRLLVLAMEASGLDDQTNATVDVGSDRL